METIDEDEDSFVSNTDAIIYADLIFQAGLTHEILTAAGSGDGDNVHLPSERYNNTCHRSELRGGLLPDTDKTVNEESSVRLVNTLMACAEAIQENNLSLADELTSVLRRIAVSQIGGAMKKVATYFAEALSHKIHKKNPQDIVESSFSKDQLLHMSFYERCLLVKFAHFTANQSILEAFADSKRVHPDDSTDALQEVCWKLAQLAESIGVEFEFRGFVVHTLADLEASMLNIRPSNVETVAVNSVFELHRLFSIPREIEKVLDLIKQVEPKIVTIAKPEANHNESTKRSTIDLEIVESHLRREIYNLVACEGIERVVRHETLGQWRVRFNSTGFNLVPLASNTYRHADLLLALYTNEEGYRVEVKDGCLMWSWHSRPLIATSTWQIC
ncbi:hypothetical protein KY285_005563 [Solanum tuberosum]|nr:hypothetical protein KY284_005719 [Solanum tuberosum]KAH0720697.1 hypothetical protein KY284_005727 [Solanum tuberosum]KAH0752415.1 hypothetical protein KY285_005563 [Solanum tuberosum]